MQQIGDAQHEISMQLDRLQDADDKTATEALALVCMFLGQGLPKDKHPAQFAQSMERVVPLISSDASEVRRNALAVVTATLNNAEAGDEVIQVQAAMDNVVHALEAHADDEGTRINAFYCLAELAQAQDGVCMDTFLDKGVPLAVDAACSGGSDKIAEASIHTLCSCAARAPATRPVLTERGALRAGAGLLLDADADVQTRALMLLAMLTGGAAEAQVALAAVDGAVGGIMAVARGAAGAGAADQDARVVATQLFKLLGANPDARPLVEAALRGSSTPAAAGAS
eukprot:jgi/Ulvmu1/1554/UM110_0017.1